jgi:hypothetical protein
MSHFRQIPASYVPGRLLWIVVDCCGLLWFGLDWFVGGASADISGSDRISVKDQPPPDAVNDER